MLSMVGGSEKIYKVGMAKWKRLSIEEGVQTFHTLWSTNLPLFAKSTSVFESIRLEATTWRAVGNSFPSKDKLK